MQNKKRPEVSQSRMKQYRALSPEEKLKHLEELIRLSNFFSTKKSKLNWKKLKEKGW